MFDALWTAALALNRTETRLNERNLTLANFTYDDEYNISDIIYKEALEVNFFGLTVSMLYLYDMIYIQLYIICIAIVGLEIDFVRLINLSTT